MNTCGCGCGTEIPNGQSFVHSHNLRLVVATKCSVVTCHENVHSHGMCGRHHRRMEDHGQLYPVTRKSNPELWFWSHVALPKEPDDCWIWLGDLDDSGYGRAVSERLSPTRTKMAHRWVYEQRVGPIPDGLHLDHLCRIPCCVNPEHLEPVTVAENVRRGLHGELREVCGSGHQATPRNTYLRLSDNARKCRECNALAAKAKRVRESAIGRVRPTGSARDFEAGELYLKGWTLKELAQRYGASPDRMGTVMRLTGTPLRRPGARPKATIRSEMGSIGYGRSA